MGALKGVLISSVFGVPLAGFITGGAAGESAASVTRVERILRNPGNVPQGGQMKNGARYRMHERSTRVDVECVFDENCACFDSVIGAQVL